MNTALFALRWLAPAAISALLTYQFMDARASAVISALQRDHSALVTRGEVAAREALAAAQATHETKEKQWASSDSSAYRRLRDAEKINANLRANIDAGRQRLYVAAACRPIGAHGLSDSSTNASMDNGTRAELNQSARSTYFALRAAITRVTEQLAAAQARLPSAAE